MSDPLDEAPRSDRSAVPGLRLTGRRIRDLGRPFRGATAAISLLRVSVTATRVAQALLVARILGHVLHRHGPVAPSLLAIGALGMARLVLVWQVGRRSATAAAVVRANLRGQLWQHLTELGPGYLVRRRTGTVEVAVVDGVERLANYYAAFVPLALSSVLSVAVVVTWVLVLDPATGLVLVAAAALVALAPVLSARAFGEAGRQFSEAFGRAASEYLDAIQGLLTLRAFNASERWGRRLVAECEELSADATSLAGLATMHIGFASLGMAAGTVLGVALAAQRATHHAVSGSALLAIVLLSRECFAPLGDLRVALPSAYQAVAAANGVVDLLDAEPEVAEPLQPARLVRSSRPPSIVFDAVSFAYRDDRRPALDQVSLEVAPGEMVALIGPSGAGKSTIVSLLLRFFDPQAGTITVGGHDVRELARRDLRSLISVTFQETYLFGGTIRHNLLMARPDATPGDIEAASRQANAHDFVMALPEGYDTVVGERGTRLSGGERQRLAIARALLADSPILVLDEPTSNVDAASEALISAAIERLTVERTTIVIAHRLSTIERADRVIVLDAGRVRATGSPRDLPPPAWPPAGQVGPGRASPAAGPDGWLGRSRLAP